jgi:opacity protein-like surface antigen
MKKAHYILIHLLLFSCFQVHAQNLDSLLSELETTPGPLYALSTFESTRVVLGQSVEAPVKEDLTLIISHRFGNIKGGIYDFLGMDQAYNRLGLEYGFNDIFGLAVGRNSFEKTYDGAFKFRVLRQQRGAKQVPLSVSWYSAIFINSLKWTDPERDNLFTSRLSYVNQLLIARKFSKRFSLQLSPSHIHRNLVKREVDQNDVFAIGVGGKYNFSKKISVNAEYFWLLPGQTADDFTNNFSLGFDFLTGGHVFQLHISNAQGTIEKDFIAGASDLWKDGDLYLGFNIYRVFPLGKKRKNIY